MSTRLTRGEAVTTMDGGTNRREHAAARVHGEPINRPPLTHYKSAEACPDRAKHTPDPPGHIAWHEWAEKKARTHTQHQCPTCGFWVIWKRKRKVAA